MPMQTKILAEKSAEPHQVEFDFDPPEAKISHLKVFDMVTPEPPSNGYEYNGRHYRLPYNND